MDNQGQGWLRGAIIAAAVAAAGVYLISRSDKPGDNASDAVSAAASTGRKALDTAGSSELAKRGSRIAELVLGNVSNQALNQAKALLKDAVAQLDDLVDQL
jgi:hypothetical protein